MGKTKIVELNEEQRKALEKGYKNGKSHAFRTRCRMVLLKSEKRTSLEVADFLGCCEVAVNNWLARYEADGIDGLKTRKGRGRPPILSQQNAEHLQKVKAEIKKHPNSVKTVVAALEEDLNLAMHPETLKRFLKKMVIDSAYSTNVAQIEAGGFDASRKGRSLKKFVGILPVWVDRSVFRR